MAKVIEMPELFRAYRIEIFGERDCSLVTFTIQSQAGDCRANSRSVSGILEAMNCMENLGLSRQLAGDMIRSLVSGERFILDPALISDFRYETFMS